MELRPVKKESISEQVFEQMKSQISSGKWKTGEKLPSETELASIFHVSRVTIRNALQRLSTMGLVETRFGEGSFVSELNIGRQVKTVLLPSVYLQPHNVEEILQFRCAIEVETAGLAALFKDVYISAPLLYSEGDGELTARAMHGAFSDLVGDDILILIASGHKTDGAEEIAGFEQALQKHIKNSYVATLHGERRLYKVIRDMKQNGIEAGRVVFVPMEFMAGEKVENEVSQEYTDLVQRLIDEGYTVETVFRGLAEYDEFQRIYMKHLYDSMR